MKEAARAVIEFNHDLLGIAPRPIATMPTSEYKHLRKALLEELEELETGYVNDDLIVMVDALLDGIYFAVGGLYKMGLSADQIHACFMYVHECNMKKMKGVVERRATGDVPDAVKPDGFVGPELEMAKVLGLAGE